MAPRRAKVNKFDSKKLSANDVICPICRSILIKPITLPCSHDFCSSCFETTRQITSVVCPLCGVRVGSWLRTATKSKKLVNETLWQSIQNLFPLQVNKKLNGREENNGDSVTEVSDDKNANSTKTTKELITNLKCSELQKIDKLNNIMKLKNKQRQLNLTVSSVHSVTESVTGKTQTVPNLEKTEKRPNLINNFATKEYTCRILCQNVNPKETQKNMFKESQLLMQKKNKRIHEITESEVSNDRSNSIESECLYFKPIDYRHNPPSEGLAPIKVPTRKPNVSPHIKILAPSGQNQINMNYLESAFARLCSRISEEKIEACKKENVQSQEDNSVTPLKRKLEKTENKAKKKMKTSCKPVENLSVKSKKSIDVTLTKVCDSNQCKNSTNPETFNLSISSTDVKNVAKFKQPSKTLITEEHIKRSLQEQADFELATKLQQTYNQTKYSTRSSVLKRMAAKNQVKMEGIMTPYEVN